MSGNREIVSVLIKAGRRDLARAVSVKVAPELERIYAMNDELGAIAKKLNIHGEGLRTFRKARIALMDVEEVVEEATGSKVI